jgi:hypothetical protein
MESWIDAAWSRQAPVIKRLHTTGTRVQSGFRMGSPGVERTGAEVPLHEREYAGVEQQVVERPRLAAASSHGQPLWRPTPGTQGACTGCCSRAVLCRHGAALGRLTILAKQVVRVRHEQSLLSAEVAEVLKNRHGLLPRRSRS